jgi:hypothetical protein
VSFNEVIGAVVVACIAGLFWLLVLSERRNRR